MNNKIWIGLVAIMAASGCSTAPKYTCGLPDLPSCVSVEHAYKASLDTIGKSDVQKKEGYGYNPTSQPTETIEIKKKMVKKDDKVKVVESVKAYLDKTRPLSVPDGVAPNGAPLAPGGMTDNEQYYATTPDGLPTGYVPTQFVRVWVPRWVTRSGDMMHESYFDMILDQGHWAVGIASEDLRSVRKKSHKKKHQAGYVKYVAGFPWGSRTWESDAQGNVTVTEYNSNTGKRSIRHYPNGENSPFPMGKQVYPPVGKKKEVVATQAVPAGLPIGNNDGGQPQPQPQQSQSNIPGSPPVAPMQ